MLLFTPTSTVFRLVDGSVCIYDKALQRGRILDVNFVGSIIVFPSVNTLILVSGDQWLSYSNKTNRLADITTDIISHFVDRPTELIVGTVGYCAYAVSSGCQLVIVQQDLTKADNLGTLVCKHSFEHPVDMIGTTYAYTIVRSGECLYTIDTRYDQNNFPRLISFDRVRDIQQIICHPNRAILLMQDGAAYISPSYNFPAFHQVCIDNKPIIKVNPRDHIMYVTDDGQLYGTDVCDTKYTEPVRLTVISDYFVEDACDCYNVIAIVHNGGQLSFLYLSGNFRIVKLSTDSWFDIFQRSGLVVKAPIPEKMAIRHVYSRGSDVYAITDSGAVYLINVEGLSIYNRVPFAWKATRLEFFDTHPVATEEPTIKLASGRSMVDEQ